MLEGEGVVLVGIGLLARMRVTGLQQVWRGELRLLLDQDQLRGTGRLATWFVGRVRRGDTCQESAQRNSLSPAVDLGFILMEIYSEKD